LREFFDADWQALRGEGGLVEPGHQFEWAWLLERWGLARGKAAARAAARRLFVNGLKGVDPVREVAVNALWDDFSVRDGDARLWPQTEHLKARAVRLAANPGPGPKRRLEAALEHCSKRYVDPANGGWHEQLARDGRVLSQSQNATSVYHVVAALSALLRVAG
jgi:mannose-6-phosphate isomerase